MWGGGLSVEAAAADVDNSAAFLTLETSRLAVYEPNSP